VQADRADREDARAHKEALAGVIRSMAEGGEILAPTTIVAVIAEEDPAMAQEGAIRLREAFSRVGLRAAVEDYLALDLFLRSALPMGFECEGMRAMKRNIECFAANISHMLPLYGAYPGTPSPEMLLTNLRGELITHSDWDMAAAHFVVAGATGSGKGVFTIHKILANLRLGNHVVWTIDKEGSFTYPCEAVGGRVIRYDLHDPPRFNVCRGSLTPTKRLMLVALVAQMVTRGKRDLDSAEEGIVSLAIRAAYDRARGGRDVWLSDIRRILENWADPRGVDLALGLVPYTQGGEYGDLFDGDDTLDFDQEVSRGVPWFAFELGELANRPEVSVPVCLSQLDGIMRCCITHPEMRKSLIWDEGWVFLRSAQLARFVDDYVRTMRKFNGQVGFMTQSLRDLGSDLGAVILSQDPTLYMLRHSANDVRQVSEMLKLSHEEQWYFEQCHTQRGAYSRLMIRHPSGAGMVQLICDGLAYWLATTHPPDKNMRRRRQEELRAAGRPHDNMAVAESLAQDYPMGTSGS
jgi:type IV secretory pathway VirB4 component